MLTADGHGFIDGEIARAGLAPATLRHSPCADSCIYVIDTALDRPSRFRFEGPPAFSISIFLTGSGTMRMDGGASLEVRPGRGTIFISNRVTSGEHFFAGGQRIRCVDFRYAQPFFRWLDDRPSGDNPLGLGEVFPAGEETLMMSFEAPPAVTQIAAEVAERSPAAGAAGRLFLTAKSIELLSRLPDLLHGTRYAPATLIASRSRLEKAREILSTHYGEDWSIPKLARHIGLNERKLKEGFRLLVGETPHAYLREQRLTAAKDLLERGASVTVAAHEVGFTNLSHFAKSFRERYGLSPSSFGKRVAEAIVTRS